MQIYESDFNNLKLVYLLLCWILINFNDTRMLQNFNCFHETLKLIYLKQGNYTKQNSLNSLEGHKNTLTLEISKGGLVDSKPRP